MLVRDLESLPLMAEDAGCGDSEGSSPPCALPPLNSRLNSSPGCGAVAIGHVPDYHLGQTASLSFFFRD